jgi:hypothetical protein
LGETREKLQIAYYEKRQMAVKSRMLHITLHVAKKKIMLFLLHIMLHVALINTIFLPTMDYISDVKPVFINVFYHTPHQTTTPPPPKKKRDRQERPMKGATATVTVAVILSKICNKTFRPATATLQSH